MQAQLAAEHMSDSLKLELNDLQKRLKQEQEARAKLTESNQSFQKVCMCVCFLMWVGEWALVGILVPGVN